MLFLECSILLLECLHDDINVYIRMLLLECLHEHNARCKDFY